MQTITGTLTETGASAAIYVEPGETFTALVEVADMEIFEGTVAIERSRDGVNFETARDIDNVALIATGADMAELEGEVFNATIRNTDTKRNAYRVRATVGADDGLSYTLTEVVGDRITILLRDRNGRAVAWALDDGRVELGLGVASAKYSTITLGAVVGTEQQVTIALRDGANLPIANRRMMHLYWSDADGVPTAKADDQASITIDAGVVLSGNGLTANQAAVTAHVVTDADGAFQFTIDNAGAAGVFDSVLALSLDDGVVLSAALAVPIA